jgi:integrase
MTAKVSRSRRKAKTGSVKVRNSNNRLQLVFTHAGKRHFVSLGLSDTPLNMKQAQDIAFEVQRDLEYGEFDPTYQKYKPAAEVTESSGEAEADTAPGLMTLWNRYVDYIATDASPNTVNGTYDPVKAHMQRCKTDGLEDPLQFRKELLKATTSSQARRTLMQLSAACDWGLKHEMVDANPFKGMYLELEATKERGLNNLYFWDGGVIPLW